MLTFDVDTMKIHCKMYEILNQILLKIFWPFILCMSVVCVCWVYIHAPIQTNKWAWTHTHTIELSTWICIWGQKRLVSPLTTFSIYSSGAAPLCDMGAQVSARLKANKLCNLPASTSLVSQHMEEHLASSIRDGIWILVLTFTKPVLLTFI